MSSEIARLISRYVELTAEEEDLLTHYIPVKAFKKGEHLLTEGQVPKASYFNVEGLVRKYLIVDGEDRTVAFYAEGDSIASIDDYVNQTPANHFVECIEDCRLAILGGEQEQILFEKMPKFESLCRIAMEGDFGKQQNAQMRFIVQSPENRYLDLLKTRPDLLQRVQQYHLASYLGIKPESLSRIRKRIAEKER